MHTNAMQKIGLCDPMTEMALQSCRILQKHLKADHSHLHDAEITIAAKETRLQR